MVAYFVTGGILLVYAVLVWFLPEWMHLRGTDVWILRISLWLIGLVAAGSFLWFYRKNKAAKQSQADEPAGDSSTGDIDALVHEAIRRLKTSTLGRGATLGNLPLIYLLGAPGSAKTHTIVHSALDPELLAGQVYQDNNILPTRVANIWYSRAALFVDPAGSLLTQSSRWNRLIKLVQPGRMSSVGKRQQAPRAAIVCFECPNFMAPGASEATLSAARKLGTRLQEISQSLGISFPVYVLFTKLDKMSFFVDFARGLMPDEASQVLGATLPVRSLATGVYSEEETKRLTKAFDELFYSLAEKRLDLLARTHDNEQLPGIYEFPRELRKLRTFLVQFLVELGRPSQLSTNPFLRGFYFSGARPVVVEDSAAAAQMEQVSEAPPASAATVIFSSGSRPAAAPAPVRSAGSRKVPQWVFLSQLFNDVIAKDRVAFAASGFSSRVSLLRRIGLITAGLVGLVLITAFLISFLGNHALENNVRSAVGELQAVHVVSNQPASFADLQKLDRLRQELATLSDYEKNGVPWRLRWGLYIGDRIYPDAQRLYFDRFQQLLLGDTQARLVSDFRALPAQPSPADDYKRPYEELKAYLITTSNHDKSTVDFLAPALTRVWANGRGVDAERLGLAARQFSYYSQELPSNSFFAKDNDAAAVAQVRTYLAKFSAIDRLYAPLLAAASQNNPSVSYSDKFPESSGVVTSNHRVSGAFTAGGFAFMDKAFQNPAGAIGGEEWVLGKVTASELDQAAIQQKLRERYDQEFVREWRTVLETSSINPYKDLADADQKLEKLSGPASPLLELFWFVSSNTNVSAPAAKDPFASAQAVEPPGDPNKKPEQVKTSENGAYTQALSDLGAKIDAIVHSPTGMSDQQLSSQAIQSAATAKAVSEQTGGARVDNTYHTENLVHRLLEQPITDAEQVLGGEPAKLLNAAGKQFCDQLAQLSSKYPFNPKSSEDLPVDQFNAAFAPKTGSLWTFYENPNAKLSQYLTKQGSSYAATSAGTVKINPAFVEFFNRMAAASDAFYPSGSPAPKFAYTLKVMPSNLEGVVLKVGNETLSGTGQQKTFNWTGSSDPVAATTAGSDVLGSYSGPWAIFHFVADATTNPQTRLTPNGGDLEWLMQSNGKTILLQNGKPKSYNYQLQVNGWNPFGTQGLAGMRCVAHVALQ